MKQFKELSIDEQLDLVKHVLEGGKLEVLYQDSWLIDHDQDEDSITFTMKDTYRKMSDTLQMLYHEADIIQSKIDAELKRLGEPVTGGNTSPVQSPSEQDKSSESGSMERITLENWKSLGIKVGDKVEVVRSHEFTPDTYTITDLEVLYYEDDGFIQLNNKWWWYKDSDEVYLIRTEEGSLG